MVNLLDSWSRLTSTRIYFACDTALFSDMKLYADNVDVAVLPIGDLFTMGIEDSVTATKMINRQKSLASSLWDMATHLLRMQTIGRIAFEAKQNAEPSRTSSWCIDSVFKL